MKTKLLIALGIMGVIAAGYWWQASRVPAPQQAPAEVFAFDTVTKSSESDRAVVAIEYPYFKEATTVNQQRVNLHMDTIIGAIEKDFRQNVQDSIPVGDDRSTLNVKYQVVRNDERVASIRLDVGWYISGAAHPSAYTTVLNFDLANTRQIKLEDLFPGSPDYLARVASKAAAALKEKFAKEDIDFDEEAKAGTAATPENYQNFLITKDALVIIFDPYQVGPWAIGIQEVSIPFKDLGISI